MRNLVPLCLLAISLAACGGRQTDETPVFVKGKTLISLPVSTEKVKGTYTGDFKGSPVAITLNYVTDHRASGYNVHKGLVRNLTGTIEATPDGLHLLLSEPGNNEYDGKFDLLIDTVKWTGKGTWTPLKKGEQTSFVLQKRKAGKDEDPYGMTFLDTLQNAITLKPDGSCTYSYLADTTTTGQPLTIRGNYTKEKGMVTIYWQKNDAFPSGKSVFKLTEHKPYKDDDEYVERSLKGEGKVFNQLYD